MQVAIPGRVWRAVLDPEHNPYPVEAGLPQPDIRKRGVGSTYHFSLTLDQAYELADYMEGRANEITGRGGLSVSEREMVRAMTETAFSLYLKVRTLRGAQPQSP